MAVASIVARLSAQVSEFQRSFDDATRTTTNFEKKFAGVASDVVAHQQRLNKAFSSFSGDNLIRDANEFAAAIGKIGGASKLTAAEQTRVNATVTEALAKYAALGQTAPAALTNLAKATAQIKPIPDLFSGKDTINKANDYAKAVTAVGGASKLTAAEQKNVNTVVTDALAKYKALGQEAPKALHDLAAATKTVEAPTKSVGTSLNGLVTSVAGVAAGMVTAQAAIGAFNAVVGAVGSVVSGAFGFVRDAAAHTAKLGDELFVLSQKTGVSVESLSAFKFVAAQTDTSLEAITGSVFKLEANLGKGAKATSAALRDLGLSLKEMQAADPAVAFTTIIAKLGQIPNAAERASTGMALFGKSFQGIAQLSQEDLPALIRQAEKLGLVMSTETAVAADRFGDAMGVIRAKVEGLSLQIGARLLPAMIALSEGFGGVFVQAMRSATTSTALVGLSFDRVAIEVGRAAGEIVRVLALLVGATAKWATDTATILVGLGNDFLDYAKTFVTVGRIIDAVATGGDFAPAFDKLSGKIAETREKFNSLITPVVTAGRTVQEFAANVATAAADASDEFAIKYATIKQEIQRSADEMRRALKNIGTGGSEGAAEAADAFKSFGKNLSELTAQIDRAFKTGTSLAEVMRLFGDEAAKATEKAHAWGIAVSSSVDTVSRAFNKAALDKSLTKLADGFSKFANKRFEDTFKKLQSGAHDGALGLVGFWQDLKKLDDGFSKFADKRFERTFDKLSSSMRSADSVASELSNSFGRVFIRVGASLPALFAQGLQQGGLTGALISVADGASKKFGEVFKDGTERVLKDSLNGIDSNLTFGERAAGWGAAAAQSFSTGFQTGLQNPGAMGALSSVANGFAAGFAVGGPWGGFAGAAIGLAGNLIGSFKNAREAAKALRIEMGKLETQFGGRANLTDLAERAGFSLPTRSANLGGPAATAQESIDAIFASGNAADFNERINALNKSLAEYEARLKAIDSATAGVNARTAIFAKQFAAPLAAKAKAAESGDTGDAAKASQQIQELAQRTQPEFERLGLFVKDTFAAMVKESGNAIGAITALAPSFKVLKDGITEFGLTSTGVIDTLLGSFNLVTDEALKPFFENISASGQILAGLFDAKALSPEGFQALAADIGQSIQEIVNRGGDMAKTLALSQPQLQKLWEGQERLGTITDDTTQRILDQAEQQGLVGATFKDTNEKILDILFEINRVLGGAIPASMAALPGVAATAGAGIDAGLSAGVNTAAANVDARVGAGLRGLPATAATAGTGIDAGLTAGVNSAAAKIDPAMRAGLQTLSASAHTAGADLAAGLGAGIETAKTNLETLSASAHTAGAGIETGLSAGVKNAAGTIDPTMGQALRDLNVPAGEAGEEMRRAIAVKAMEAAREIESKVGNSLKGLGPKATLAAKDISNELAKVRAPKIEIPDVEVRVKWKVDPRTNDWDFGPLEVPALASGGIVRRPTLALVGERGPEAVIPLAAMGSMRGGGDDTTVVLELDGLRFGEAVLRYGGDATDRFRLRPR